MIQIGQQRTGHTVTMASGTNKDVTLSWAALTDTGLRRDGNEDSYLAQTPIFAVTDGMGGHSAGEIASAAVVGRLAEHASADSVEPSAIEKSLRLAVEDMRMSAGDIETGTGTTVTGIAITVSNGAPAWLVFNIGDSRVYVLRHRVLEQVTRDHSVVQELIDAGHITPEEADVHPHGNVITRAVGFHEAPVPDFALLPIEEGMRLLICSDGLTKELTNYGIRHFLLANPQPQAAVNELVEAALGNGGRDNVTVIVVDVLAVSDAEARG